MENNIAMARIKSTLDDIHDASTAGSLTNTDVMSGIEPLASSVDVTPAASPNPKALSSSARSHQPGSLVHGAYTLPARNTNVDADELFSPVGVGESTGRQKPDVVGLVAANVLGGTSQYAEGRLAPLSRGSDRMDRRAISAPNTQGKEWESVYKRTELSENKYDYDHYRNTKVKTGDHREALSDVTVNRQLFLRSNYQSHKGKHMANQDSAKMPHGAYSHGHELGRSREPIQANVGVNGKHDVKFTASEGVKGAVYSYNTQSDRIDIEHHLPAEEALSNHSADSMPPHYHDDTLTAPSTIASAKDYGMVERGEEVGVSGNQSRGSRVLFKAPPRLQPSASSPKDKKYLMEGSHTPHYQSSPAYPTEFAEIESLRQNLSNLIASPDAGRNESLSELLVMRGSHEQRQSTDTAKTDSLICAQAFPGVSPSPDPQTLDSGLASHQTSHLTSSHWSEGKQRSEVDQRSGVGGADTSIRAENRVLREGLERERCRRRHCEEQIATLQSRILETQQLLAVAQATEKKKDHMIAQLDKTMAKVSASLKYREQERVTMLEELKTANDALKHESDKQNLIIQEQNKELAEAKQTCEELKRSEKAFRAQLKEHQTESAKRWEEAQQLAQLTNQQMECMGEDRQKAEQQLRQVQEMLGSEREEWRRKEKELEQRVSSMETERIASQDEMERRRREEESTLEETRKDLARARREAEDARKEKENAVGEKEKVSLEQSLQEARWEARLQKRQAELQEAHKTQLRERMEEAEREGVEEGEKAREGHRKQVAEMRERHSEELRVQKDVHQRETTQREKRWNEMQQQYQSRLAECQQEILKLSTKLEKAEHHRFGIVGKVQHLLQSQCNQAVMLVSALDSSPATPVTTHSTAGQRRKGQREQEPGGRVYTLGVKGPGSDSADLGNGYRSRSEQLEDKHAEILRLAQEQAKQAMKSLQLSHHGQPGSDQETAPHESALPFPPLTDSNSPPPSLPSPSPSTPTTTVSEASQDTIYHDISTTGFYPLPEQPLSNSKPRLSHEHRAQPLGIAHTHVTPIESLYPRTAQRLGSGNNPAGSRDVHRQMQSSVHTLDSVKNSVQHGSVNMPSTDSRNINMQRHRPVHTGQQPHTGINGHTHMLNQEHAPKGGVRTVDARTLDSAAAAVRRYRQSGEWAGLDRSHLSTLLEASSSFVELSPHEASRSGVGMGEEVEEEREEGEGWSQQHSHMEDEQDFVGWMSQHESTLTSSPTKETTDPSPDLNIHTGQGLTLHIPPPPSLSQSSVTHQNPYYPSQGVVPGRGYHHQPHLSSHPQGVNGTGQSQFDISTGPLEMLDSPISSTQGDWKEVALQKYISKLLEQSPSGADQPARATNNPAQQRFIQQAKQPQSGAIQKETVPYNQPRTVHPPGQAARGQGPTGKGQQAPPTSPQRHQHQPGGRQGARAGGLVGKGRGQQPQGITKGPGQRDRLQKQAGSSYQGGGGKGGGLGPRANSQPTTNRPRSSMGMGKEKEREREKAGGIGSRPQGAKPAQKSSVWR